MGCVYDRIVVFQGTPNFELRIFGINRNFEFRRFFFGWAFLRRVPTAPGAATDGGSSSRLACEQNMSGVDASVLRVTFVLKYTLHVWSGLRQDACAIGGVTLGPHGLLLDAFVMTWLLSNRCSRLVNVVDIWSW